MRTHAGLGEEKVASLLVMLRGGQHSNRSTLEAFEDLSIIVAGDLGVSKLADTESPQIRPQNPSPLQSLHIDEHITWR